jgi:ABC-type branched-subunit amino acid transport system substrate-binding protein
VQTAADQKFVTHLRTEISERVAVRPRRIGVLLPLSSSSAFLRSLAQETLDGLRLAIQFPPGGDGTQARLSRLLGQDLPVRLERERPPPADPLGSFELVIRDTANEPKVAVKAVESLVEEEQVIAIIGPIARAESEAAAARAEELGVPLMSLSVSLDLPADNRFVFRHSKSQEEEVQDLVRYAVDYLQARRFAILYPDNSYGRAMMELFWDDVRAANGQVVAVSPFTTSSQRAATPGREAVGFKEIFGQFTGLYRTLTPEDKALLDAVGDSHPDPIVDFDALYIPIGPDGLGDLQLIAPYPVTVDAEKTLYLGSRFWNDDAVIVAGDGKLDGAVFVDSYDRSSANPKVAAFQSRHRIFFGHRPDYRAPSYYTGLGYDTANLLMGLLASPANQSRVRLSEALRTISPTFGVTGWTTFRANGESVKESMFFRIKGNEIVRVVP